MKDSNTRKEGKGDGEKKGGGREGREEREMNNVQMRKEEEARKNVDERKEGVRRESLEKE